MTTGRQSRAARALLGISQADLARLSGVSPARVTAFENGADCLRSTCDRIAAALELKGARFSQDGVRVVPAGEKLLTAGQTPSLETRRLALQIVNSGRRARNLPLLRDDDE